MRTVLKLTALGVLVSSLAACATSQHASPVSVQAQQDAKIKKEIYLSAFRRQKQTVVQYKAKKASGKFAPTTKQQQKKPKLTGEKAVVWANKQAQRLPNTRSYTNSIMTYNYQPGGLYQVYCAPLHITDIELQPGEEITSVAAGDTLRWQVSEAHSGSGNNYREHLFIKPMDVGISNTMVITTTQRTYHLQLHSTNKTAMMVVKWHYPAIKPSPQMAAVKSRQQMLDDLSLKSLDFHYQISLKEGPKPAWMPLTVFSDAGKTYIQFPAQMQQAPLLFIGHSPGSDEIVNYRVAGNYYVIDSVVNNAQLRLGRSAGLLSVVQITKEGS